MIKLRNSFLKVFLIFILINLFFTKETLAICSNPGKDGVAGPTNSILTDYYPGNTSVSLGATSINLGASRLGSVGISAGDLLLIIQMQDSTINSSNTNSYGANNGTGKGQTNINSVGLYEYAIATNSISISGGAVNLSSSLINSYTNADATSSSGQKRFQVIRVPQYSSLTLSGTVTAPAWNGRTGGIIAFDVAGVLNFNSATIDMTGKGFRGGGAIQVYGGSGGTNTDYRYSSGDFHGSKGEGTGGTPKYIFDGTSVVDTGMTYTYPNGSFGRGAPGNAGGGGNDGRPSNNDQNSGGGGGSNYGAGGQGGNSWSSNLAVGGLGGASFPATPSRIVMGGGGGAGSRNNSSGTTSSGGLGGGIVFIRAGSTGGSSGTINTNGTTPPVPDNDGSGGGGAGGSVLFYTANNSLSGITINAKGANGANNCVSCGIASAHGPGGGGGGGYITASSGAIVNIQNGIPGYTTTSNTHYGAPDSGAGSPSVGTSIPVNKNDIPGAGSNPDCLPNLTVTKSTSTPNLTNTSTGVTGKYIITVSNEANKGNAEQVNISDLLPSGFTYLLTNSVNLLGGATRSPINNPIAGSGNPNWGVFSIPGNASVSISFDVNIPNTIYSGTYQNPAQAQYLDPQRTSNAGTKTSSYNSSSTNNEDIKITSYDYGDAPDNYKTLNASNGARHTIDTNIKLGSLIDIDTDGQPSINADGDNLNTSNDEDGLITPIADLYTSSSSYSISIRATNNIGTGGKLRAWIDFNRDNQFQNTESSNLINVPNGTNNGTFILSWSSIPNNIISGKSYLRIRLTTDTLNDTDFVGSKSNGEVEDYTLDIKDVYDYGDAPDTYKTLKSSNGARHAVKNNIKIGSLIDSENDGFPGTNANGDNNNNLNDEDGINSIPLLHTSFNTYSIDVEVHNNTGNSSTLVGWIDFNRDGQFQAIEGTITNVPNNTNGNITLTWNNIGKPGGPPISAGDTYLRIRLTTDSINTSNFDGAFSDGEVEDYKINISNTTYSISGKVFEDINYGGGAGRNLINASGIGRPNVRVELYDNLGNFLSSNLTDPSGNYTFSSLIPKNYTVRVVNTTVRSSRLGNNGTELGVQTFRTDVSSGTVIDITNRVGGEDPTKIDSGNGATTLSSLITGTNTPQSITNINLLSNTTDIDFGFNFDTIVSTRDTGQGSLRQFIINSNLLDNSGLSQVGQTPGKEVSIFMIPNGVANPGQNTSYTNQLTGYGAAKIVLSLALPIINAPDTVIDASTQTNNVKAIGGVQTNIGQTAGNVFVGVSQTYLAPFDNPEIEIVGLNAHTIITNTNATGFIVRNIAFLRAGILVNGNNSLVENNLMGMQANGVESGASYTGAASTEYHIRIGDNTNNIIVRHNYVKTNNSGIRRDTGGTYMTIEYNEVTRPDSGQTTTYDGILLIGNGSNDTIQYNYVHDMVGAGSELGYNTNANVVNLVVQENTYNNNGKNINGTSSAEPINIIVRTIGSGSVVKIFRNIISHSGGAGIIVQRTNRVRITENSIFSNGLVLGKANLGIDLRSDDPDPNSIATNLDGVTPNDGIINSSLANNGTDYPIITSAILNGDSLQLKGYVGSAPNQSAFGNSLVEVFKAADDGNNNGPILLGDGKSVQHGEGQIYLGNCYADSNGNIDCIIPNIGSKITDGEYITTTATNSTNDTSEFSSVKVVGPDNFVFLPNNSSNALPGSTIYYTHYIKSDLAGNVVLNFSSVKGWTYTFFRDVNENSILDNGDTPYSNVNGMPLGNIYNDNSNHSIKIIVKVEIPTNVPVNTVDTLTLTATLTPSDPLLTNNIIATTQDITTISDNLDSGVLKLIKSVLPSGNQPPGTTLLYTINYENMGSTDLKNIKIQDVTPANTKFLDAIFVVGSGNIIKPPLNGTGIIIWEVNGILAPGSSGEVSFSVIIN